MNLIKSLKLIFSALAAICIVSACSNKVDVIGEWKEIPVVYAVFSPTPENGDNYFRIEKAFLDPDTDAFQIAQNPDSIYYAADQLEVIVYERTGTAAYRILDTLERIDANSIGMVRDSGIFAQNPNFVYVMRERPIGGSVDRFYKMVIKNKYSGKVFTQYCKGIAMGDYNATDNTHSLFRFTLPAQSRPIRWSHIDPGTNENVFDKVTFNWSQPANAAIYDLTISLRYYEFQVDLNQTGEPELPGTRVEKTASWKAVRNSQAQGEIRLTNPFDNEERFYSFIKADGGSVAQELNGENFYNFLASNLTDVVNTGSNIRRCAIKIDARVDAAGPELSEYIRARNANQNLIGGLFPADPFSNIEDGLGLFSYKFFITRRNYNIESETFEYLNEGEITRNLGFRNYGCN
jgi:hypothetical protein